MHDEQLAAGGGNRVDEGEERRRNLPVSSTPSRHFTVTGNAHRGDHRRDAVGDQRRLLHQAGAESPGLHAVGRAADVEVDLVVAPLLRRCARPAPAAPDRCRPAAAPPDARTDRSPAVARDRRGSPPARAPSRCTAAHAARARGGRRGNDDRSSPSSGRRTDAGSSACWAGLNSCFSAWSHAAGRARRYTTRDPRWSCWRRLQWRFPVPRALHRPTGNRRDRANNAIDRGKRRAGCAS